LLVFSHIKPKAKKKRDRLAESWLTGERINVLANTGDNRSIDAKYFCAKLKFSIFQDTN
jgi:hypothetical protein